MSSSLAGAQGCLIMPLCAWGVDSARWQEEGWGVGWGGEDRRDMLGLPCLPEAKTLGRGPQGLPTPLWWKELWGSGGQSPSPSN